MTPKMDLKWIPKGALKYKEFVLFAIPKRSHKTALILVPFGCLQAPKRLQNLQKFDLKAKPKTKTEQEAFEDRLGAVLGPSWVDLETHLGK